MFDKNYIVNCPLQAPGLTYSSNQKTGTTTNPFIAKANGTISAPIGPVDMPDLDTSVGFGGVTGAIPLASGGMQRVYTFLGEIDPLTGATTFSIVHSADIPNRPITTDDINLGNAGDEKKFVLGCLLLQTIGADFIPGTSTFGAFNSYFFDNFGFIGQ